MKYFVAVLCFVTLCGCMTNGRYEGLKVEYQAKVVADHKAEAMYSLEFLRERPLGWRYHSHNIKMNLHYAKMGYGDIGTSKEELGYIYAKYLEMVPPEIEPPRLVVKYVYFDDEWFWGDVSPA